MSYLNSTNIIVNSAPPTGFRDPARTKVANSPVVDFLLPQLSACQTSVFKGQELLENIDFYMLQETEELLKRISNFCLHLGLPDLRTFNIKLAAPALAISGNFDEKKQLDKLVNQDPWIRNTFNWLHANYTALAYSQELLRFSFAYEKNRQQALIEFKHFEQRNQGMDCYVNCSVENGIPTLALNIESPLMVYHLKN